MANFNLNRNQKLKDEIQNNKECSKLQNEEHPMLGDVVKYEELQEMIFLKLSYEVSSSMFQFYLNCLQIVLVAAGLFISIERNLFICLTGAILTYL